MTEHEPECPCIDKAEHPDGCLCCEVASPCICDRLRACEERVLLAAEKRHEGELAGEWQHGVTAGKVLGYADALDAVREAVAAAHAADSWTFTDDSLALALSAIDALRGES